MGPICQKEDLICGRNDCDGINSYRVVLCQM